MNPGPPLHDGTTFGILPHGRTTSRPSPIGRDDRSDFSLVLGGPLYQLLRRMHLSGDALELIRHRIIVITSWHGCRCSDSPSWKDRPWAEERPCPSCGTSKRTFASWSALPLLIVAELVVHQRMRWSCGNSWIAHLIPDAARCPASMPPSRQRFGCATRCSPKLLLIALVYIVGVTLVWRHYVALSTATWYAMPDRRGDDALADRDVVCVREPAALPVPVAALVLSGSSSGRASSGRCRAST